MSASDSKPPEEANILTQFVPEEPSFVPTPMQAPAGQAPESLLGKRMAAARGHYSLNIEALSRLTKAYDEAEGRGISPATLARYESGESAPGAREIRLLCVALDVSAQWLIFGDVGTGGESQAEQALLSALKGVIAEERMKSSDGGIVAVGISQWSQAQTRAKRLGEARKP
jgi:transcriptional regulator with XRE-family HTH domain